MVRNISRNYALKFKWKHSKTDGTQQRFNKEASRKEATKQVIHINFIWFILSLFFFILQEYDME